MNEKYSKKRDKQTPRRNTEKQFVCQHCGRTVSVTTAGMHHRNHCPWCLRSVHVDDRAGDRASSCGGIMEPIAVSVRRGNEWILIHRCVRCGALKGNRIAGDDNELALMSLAVRPIAQPPFPLEGLYSEQE